METHFQMFETQLNLLLSQQECLNTNEILVSFNVYFAFHQDTSCLALDVARQHLESDESHSERTALSVDILSLLFFCLNDTYFSF